MPNTLQSQLHDLEDKITIETINYDQALRSDKSFMMARQIRRKIDLLKNEAANILRHLKRVTKKE